MRKNVFIAAVLRQPLRSLALILLIAVAAFAFVLRTVEYMVVSEQINDISGHYRAIGFFQSAQPAAGDVFHNYRNIAAAADFVSNSPLIAHEDRRGAAQGLLQDMLNADILVDFGTERDDSSVAFFYGEFVGYRRETFGWMPRTYLNFRFEGAAWGYPDYFQGSMVSILLQGGQEVLTELFTEGGRYLIKVAPAGFSDSGLGLPNITNFRIEPFSAVNWLDYIRHYGVGLIIDNGSFDWLTATPEERAARDELRNIAEREFALTRQWFVPVPEGHAVDFDMPGLAELDWFEEYIWELELLQRTVNLIGTSDMTAMPHAQPDRASLIQLHRGRLINHEDYLQAANVAVVHRQFATARGLDIGDTITVRVPQVQFNHGAGDFGMGAFTTWTVGADGTQTMVDAQGGFNFLQLDVRSDLDEANAIELELEIVGTIHFNLPRQGNFDMMSMRTDHNTFIYIPASLGLPSPQVYIPQFEPYSPSMLEQLLAIGYSADEIAEMEQNSHNALVEHAQSLPYVVFDFAHNFVLNDARDEGAFQLAYGDALAAMGINLMFIPNDVAEFWAMADPIVQSITVNMLTFWGVLVLVLLLVAFLFLRSRKREFAIGRGLGMPRGVLCVRLLVTLTLLALPAIIAAGIFAWNMGLELASDTLYALLPQGEELSLNQMWLAAMLGGVLVMLILPFAIGTLRLSTRPVLELLQGGSARRTAAVQHSVALSTEAAIAASQGQAQAATVTQTTFARPQAHKGRLSRRIAATLRHSLCHVVRAPIKSLLTAVVAVAFVLSIGWLQETIDRNELEIEYLYATTFVSADVRQARFDENVMFREFGDVIATPAIIEMMESGLIYDFYLETTTHYTYFFGAEADPLYLEHLWDGIDSVFMRSGRDRVIATNNLDDLVTANSRSAAHDVAGFEIMLDGQPISQMLIEFAPGLSADDFAFVQGRPIPVIMSPNMMAERGFTLGEIISISHAFPDPMRDEQDLDYRETVAQVRIIGTHNRHLLGGEFQRDAAIMHTDALEWLMGDNIGYTTLIFYIGPSHNRNMAVVQDELRRIFAMRDAGHADLTIVFNDALLRNVVEPMEDNLSLLQVLYPIAIAVSLAIGAGLTFLMILQHAKNTAIMRVLGLTNVRCGVILWLEPSVVCIIGLLAGLGIVISMGNVLPAVFSAAYIAAVAIGAIAGIVVVVKRPPLELLQVKE